MGCCASIRVILHDACCAGDKALLPRARHSSVGKHVSRLAQDQHEDHVQREVRSRFPGGQYMCRYWRYCQSNQNALGRWCLASVERETTTSRVVPFGQA